MGALHAGHLSLVERSTAECGATVVTIFVNPTQFAPHEDLAQYPRTLDADLAALGAYDVDLVFVPTNAEMYPPGHSTFVEPPEAARRLEGECRPGFFRGVCTIVLKLFQAVPADVAYFGHKDYQQSVVVRRMVEDLDLPIRIEVCPTVREPDGLALSSRNVYLNPDERRQALAVSRSLRAAADLVATGQRDADVVREQMRQVLTDAGIERIEYVSLVEGDSLAEVERIRGPLVALVAAFVGATRLIDNLPIVVGDGQ
jgi:pantoate--beta-alanine ligase